MGIGSDIWECAYATRKGEPLMGRNTPINADEITKAQQAWAAGIVAIGGAYTAGGDYVQIAENHLDTLYAFDAGPVLFKPTKAAVDQFRTTRESALSYFIGDNDTYKEDHGFAIHPWTDVRFENFETYIHGDYAIAMGNYFFTDTDGREIKVEYTFGYFKDEKDNLKINLHHSSIPYNAA